MLDISLTEFKKLYNIAMNRANELENYYEINKEQQVIIERRILSNIVYEDEYELLDYLNSINYIKLYELLLNNPQDINLLRAMSYIIFATINST